MIIQICVGSSCHLKGSHHIVAKLQELIANMWETMYHSEGVGLAAPQVTYIMHALKEKGLAVDVEATTVEEAKASILKALGKA